MKRAYRVELKPNKEQKAYFLRCVGASRFAYNWGLDKCIKNRDLGGKHLGAIDLHKLIVVEKNTGALGWLKEISKNVPQEALRDLEVAFKRFFSNLRSKKDGKKGFPRFKKRKDNEGGFGSGECRFVGGKIKLPIVGLVDLKEHGYVPEDTYGSSRVKFKNGRWYVTVFGDFEPVKCVAHSMPVIGVDLGVKELAVISDGTVIPNHKFAKQSRKKIAKLQRAVSRKQRKSGRRKIAVLKLAIAQQNVANRRKDIINKFTTNITRNSSVIGLEDLAVKNMLRNHKLAGAIADASFREIRRQIEYKANWYGATVVVVPRFFPSSKTCSACGQIKDIPLSQRVYSCDCGYVSDRDMNAARNIAKFAASCAENKNGHGVVGSDVSRKTA